MNFDLGLINIFYNLWKNWKYGLYISPILILIPTQWGVIKNVKVVNNNHYPLYKIQIKTSLEKGKFDFNSLKFERLAKPLLSQSLNNKQDTVIMGLDEIQLRGIDNKGKKWCRIIINNIDPHSIINYKLSVPESISEENDDRATIKLNITDFSKEQPNILHRNGEIAIPFEIKD